MIAIANYDVTINGVTYEKGNKYEINAKINSRNEYGIDYFTLLEDEVVEKVDENKNKRNKTTEKVDEKIEEKVDESKEQE